MSLANPLAGLGLSTNKSSKKKSDNHAVVNDTSLDYSVKEFLEAVKSIDDAQSRLDRAGQRILQKAEEARLLECQKQGEIISSALVNGKIRVTNKNQYSDIPSEKKSELEGVLGSEINDYVEVKTSIALKSNFASDQDVLQKLIYALGGGTDDKAMEKGKELLVNWFEITQKLTVKSSFYNKYNLSSEFRNKIEPLIENKIIKQHKPTVVEA